MGVVTMVAVLFNGCGPPVLESEAVQMLAKCPPVEAERYRCGDMVQTLNALRRAGKERSLAALREYAHADPGSDDKIVVICRLLFVNPQGWKPPSLGGVEPPVNQTALKRFPLFPVALPNRVPLLLVKGYRSGGKGETPARCLKRCESLALVENDFPLGGYREAARTLFRTEAFLQLYDEQTRKEMTDIILRETESGDGSHDE